MRAAPQLCFRLDPRLAAVALVLAAACGRARGGGQLGTTNAVDPTRASADPLDRDAGEGSLAPSPETEPTPEPPVTPPLDTGEGPLPEIERQSYTCSTTLSYWARDPATGICRFAAALCHVPIGWAAFQTEEECQTDCRCQRIQPFQKTEPFSIGYAYQALACACAGGNCTLTLEEEIARRCPDGGATSAILARGCGKVEVSGGGSFTGSSAVFDAASGQLIGQTASADTLRLPCLTAVTVSGTEFACPDAERCQLCGTGDLPRCD